MLGIIASTFSSSTFHAERLNHARVDWIGSVPFPGALMCNYCSTCLYDTVCCEVLGFASSLDCASSVHYKEGLVMPPGSVVGSLVRSVRLFRSFIRSSVRSITISIAISITIGFEEGCK